MALRLEDKKVVVTEVAEIAAQALSAIAVNYQGLTVDEMTAFRQQARDANVHVRVIKNSLARRAFQGTDFECMTEGLVGPLFIAFSLDDPAAAARIIFDFSKGHPKMETALVAIGGKLYDGSELDRLSKLPTYDQAIAMMMGVMKAPVEKFVRTLSEPQAKLVRTLAAVRDQKQAA
ncbi:MAG: 50S ribosomal protein L10 [Gammaproteobacteria bacterium]|nr:50S ribosomal protein L10 [Gammaproteobacteria bacterium]